MHSVAFIAILTPICPAQERGEEPGQKIGALIKQLELEDEREAAIAELAGLGQPAVDAVIEAFEEETARARIGLAGALIRALGALGKENPPAKAKLEELAAGDNQVFATAAHNAMIAMRIAGVTLVSDYSRNLIREIDSEGTTVNEIQGVFGAWDAEILPNGNYLITEFSVSRVTERTPKGGIIWTVEGLKNPYDADRLDNGNTLIADTFGGRVIEVNAARETVWSYNKGIRPFDVDRLPNGNTLISDVIGDRVIEVDPQGNIVWEIKNLPNVHDADRLPNGNTLITLRTVNRVVELDATGAEVFRIDNLNSPSDSDRLPNGNTIVAENGMVREFDRQGKVVRTIRATWAVEVNRY